MKHFCQCILVICALIFFSCKSTSEVVTQEQPKPVVDTPGEVFEIPTQELDGPIEIQGFSSPESIIRIGNYIYVSNVGQELLPSIKDGDGFISRLDPMGEILEMQYFTQLDAPKGMAVYKDILYVTDIDRVVAFDINTRQIINEFDFSSYNTQFLNDLVFTQPGILAISATDIGKIFSINVLGDLVIREMDIPQALRGPNGLSFDAVTNKLYIVGYGENGEANGRIGVLQMSDGGTGDYTVLKPGYSGLLDGVAIADDQHLLFSNWVGPNPEGVIMVYNFSNKTITPAKTDNRFAGPADFYYDSKTTFIWVPAMMEGIIYAFPLEY